MILSKIKIPSLVIYCLLFVTAFLFVLFFSCTTSPFYEHYPFWFHGDSGIFQEMGVCILQGGTPYVDLFDHKGPILWFLQALGIWISPNWGLMALQSFFLFATLILWYKTIRLYIEKKWVIILILGLGIFFLMCFYMRGNLCEEWSLPFISWPIYIYSKRHKKSSILSISDSFIVGLCVGILALIRMNNMAPFLGFVLWFYIIQIKESKWKQLIHSSLAMIVGVIVIFIPCILYYYCKASWYGVEEMLFGTFGFNFNYISDHKDWGIVQWIQYNIPIAGLLLITCLCITKNYSGITIPTIISFIITYLTFGNRMFYHYIMIFIPLSIVTLCLLFKSYSKIGFIILGVVIIQGGIVGYNAIDCLAHRLLGNPVNTELNDGFHRFVNSIHTEERKSIYNKGLNHMGPGLFADENIIQCNRFIYKQHYELSPRLRKYQESHDIKYLKPVWVLTQSLKPITTDSYLLSNYSICDSIPGGEFEPIWCWKRNQ